MPRFYLMLKRALNGPDSALTAWQEMTWATKALEKVSPRGIEEIGRSVFGPKSNLASSDRVNVGLRNDGVVIHEFADGNGKVLGRMVEKITRNHKEAAIASCLIEAGNEPRDVFPAFYGLAREAGRYRIFMEHVCGTGAPTDLSEGHASSLATDLVRLHERLEAIRERSAMEFPTIKTFGTGNRSGLSRFTGAGANKALSARISAIHRFTEQHPLILCHNDINQPNLGVTYSGANPSAVFIDFALCGYNIPGAELHFFARRANETEAHGAFFKALSEEYARLMSLPLAVILLGAYFYAGQRVLGRNLRQKKKDPLAEPIALFDRAYDQIH